MDQKVPENGKREILGYFTVIYAVNILILCVDTFIYGVIKVLIKVILLINK